MEIIGVGVGGGGGGGVGVGTGEGDPNSTIGTINSGNCFSNYI